MEIALIAVFFLLGASLGSFAHCVAGRVLAEKNWLNDQSICHHCQKPLLWYHNLPLFSWLVLGGRSACCGQKIPSSYFWVEFFMGVAAGALFWRFGLTWPLIPALLVLVFGAVLFLTDLWAKQLPAIWLFWLFAPSVLLAALTQQTLLSVVIAGGIPLVFFLLLWLVSRGRAVGEGDIYLGAALGLSLGWPGGVVVIILAYWLGALISVILMLWQKWTAKKTLPFGPFLLTAWALVIVFQPFFSRVLILLFGYGKF